MQERIFYAGNGLPRGKRKYWKPISVCNMLLSGLQYMFRICKGVILRIVECTLNNFPIACPQCNFSNIVTCPDEKYKEVVYQPCNDNEGQKNHNMRDQIRCDNCHNYFDFYWCAGHTTTENSADHRNSDAEKWPQT